MSKEFFRSQDVNDELFFDEGPRQAFRRHTTTMTSSIATEAFDQYRQGVEITQQKHFDLGTVKIHSGEPGHKALRGNFGSSNDSSLTTGFVEPMSIDDVYDDDLNIENGSIEPLTIRSVANFSINEKPVMHSVKGALQVGNEGFSSASDITVNSFNVNEIHDPIPFIDDLNVREFEATNIMLEAVSNQDPFDDVRLMLNSDSVNDIDTYVDNVDSIEFNEKHLARGYDIENGQILSDSIAYVGLRHNGNV